MTDHPDYFNKNVKEKIKELNYAMQDYINIKKEEDNIFTKESARFNKANARLDAKINDFENSFNAYFEELDKTEKKSLYQKRRDLKWLALLDIQKSIPLLRVKAL